MRRRVFLEDTVALGIALDDERAFANKLAVEALVRPSLDSIGTKGILVRLSCSEQAEAHKVEAEGSSSG